MFKVLSLRRSSSLRLLLTALCVLVAWGAQLAHYALVSHTLCAEHGRLVHASELSHGGSHAHGPHAGEASKQHVLDQASERVDNGDAEEHEHDHCALISEHGDQATITSPAVAKQLLWSSALASRPCVWLRADGRRFDVAPKNSPPAVC